MRFFASYLGVCAIALVVSVGGAGCKRHGCDIVDPPAEPVVAKLTGSWRWVKSVGGFAGHTITPATEGYSQRLNYRNDGTYRWDHADTLLHGGRYTVERVKPNEISDSVDVIHYQPEIINGHEFTISGDTLVINEFRTADGYESTFVRE